MRDESLATGAQRGAFDEWVDCLREWQREIGIDPEWIAQYPLMTKFADSIEPEINFGRFAGQRKWERVSEIPDQEIRDELFRLIIYQADPEIRSVEQSRHLVDNAPTEFDRQRMLRHIAEETRHGWQMAYLMVTYFGEDGRRESRALLERRATRGESLIGVFNIRLNWLEVFAWHNWSDRLGKFQLKMLADSAFAPLARSIPPMLTEEGFHLLIGYQGMQRTLLGRVPLDVQQRYTNRILSASYDGFGSELSRHAERTYEWGLKAPYVDPGRAGEPLEPVRLNEVARRVFVQEVDGIIRTMNRLLPPDGPKLHLTDPRFNRHNGPYKDQRYDPHGNLLSEEEWTAALPGLLPSPADEELLQELFKDPGWIAPPDRGQA